MLESDAGEGGSNSRRPTHGQRKLQKDSLFILMLMLAAKLQIPLHLLVSRCFSSHLFSSPIYMNPPLLLFNFQSCCSAVVVTLRLENSLFVSIKIPV
ncbi:hypothetical protein RHGRI_014315 [Rhododendron griersonianum]|uniref:Uncharacterized protein n=1 Tax=Rhododendron griersonianum TaxID=479676 RepID=A0AAV6K9A2_9ERIC|nr:hypothetical protein RHGRI_014315 [Rhododendron griersonianum]